MEYAPSTFIMFLQREKRKGDNKTKLAKISTLNNNRSI